MVFAGEMNSAIEFYRVIPGKNDQGEANDAPTLLSTRMAKRDDMGGQEVQEGKSIGQFTRQYHVRYDPEIMVNANQLMIRDFDGDWNVTNIGLTGSRKRYMTIKCIKRGQDFTF